MSQPPAPDDVKALIADAAVQKLAHEFMIGACEAERLSGQPCYSVHLDRPDLWCGPCTGRAYQLMLTELVALRATVARLEALIAEREEQ